MKTTVFESAGLRLTILTPPPDLEPYVTTFYRTDVREEVVVEDILPPEAANLRMGTGRVYQAAIGAAAMVDVPAAVVSGPMSRATRLRIGRGTFWGMGLLPLGFAALVGAPADLFADRFVDADTVPLPPPLHRMMTALAAGDGEGDDSFAAMIDTLRALGPPTVSTGPAIAAAQAAVVSDFSQSVTGLAERLDMTVRTLQRFAPRHFGFPPQLLLRRQRFLRSLAKFMLDPSMKWIGAIDTCYHDQSHFLRDFRSFMLMRPSHYAQMPHPIAITAARARAAALGAPMQGLHPPPANRIPIGASELA